MCEKHKKEINFIGSYSFCFKLSTANNNHIKMPKKKKTSQKSRFRSAAKKCKGKGKGFRACMRKELKKK